MKLIEIIELRDKLKEELAVVEKFLEIAKAHGVNGRVSIARDDGEADARLQPTSPDQKSLKIPGAEPPYGTISDIVREGIQLCSDNYTVNDVEKALEKLGRPLPKEQIATALTRFANRTKEIEILHRGTGSRPTVYKK